MPFRDDLEAAQAKAALLEAENRALRAELAAPRTLRDMQSTRVPFSIAITAATLFALATTGGVVAWLVARRGAPAAPDVASATPVYAVALPTPDPPAPAPPPTVAADPQLAVTDLVVGGGRAAAAGDRISTNYVGTLEDGKEFDSSYKRQRPFGFVLGQGRVIKGWDQGIVGMRVGGKRRLVIPPELAYGARGMPPTIPANATLIFDVELVDVTPAAPRPRSDPNADPGEHM